MAELAKIFDARQGDFGDERKRNFVYPFALELVRNFSFRKALDVGCGNGSFVRYCAVRGVQLDGLDANPDMIALALERDRSVGVTAHYHIADAAAHDLQECDLAVCLFSLQDMREPLHFLKTLAQTARRPFHLIVLGESLKSLVSNTWVHSTKRRLEDCQGYDDAIYISYADWGGAESTTYCRPDQRYLDFVSATNMVVLRSGYFGHDGAFFYFCAGDRSASG